jgi:transcriptional regulator with PAS, ATPase and Fis domain
MIAVSEQDVMSPPEHAGHHAIVGESSRFKQVLETVRKIAHSPTATVLLVGESGTGKEVIARLIHNLSSATQQPFIDINCGAITETLLESELFGFEKGAFTGANVRKQGLFELANGGTIFLDEISNTSLSLQMKLLKVVENKSFRRINGVHEIQVSTRIVAATNVDLQEALQREAFREDLFYRLSVCPIYVPPLRERGDDVLLLASHFITAFSEEYERDVVGLSPQAIDYVRKHPWPGNIRQLKNAIERAVLVEAEAYIQPEHLMSGNPDATPVSFAQPEQETVYKVSPTLADFEIPDEGIDLEEVESNLILSALAKADGNVSMAARLLRINRGKLRYRMERLNLEARMADYAR